MSEEDKNPGVMTEEEVEKQILEKLPIILKLPEEQWREFVVRDYNSLARIVLLSAEVGQLGNKNFAFISEWMKKVEERLKKMEEVLGGLEAQAANDDPKRKTDHYLQ